MLPQGQLAGEGLCPMTDDEIEALLAIEPSPMADCQAHAKACMDACLPGSAQWAVPALMARAREWAAVHQAHQARLRALGTDE
jgi:hypothetical protein